MNSSLVRRNLVFTAALLPVMTLMFSPAQAAPPETTKLGPSNQNCQGVAAVDFGNIAGNCVGPNGDFPFVDIPATGFHPLLIPGPGWTCEAEGLGVNDVFGDCSGQGVKRAARWDRNVLANPPIALKPLSPLESSDFRVNNIFGDAAGQSRTFATSTPVFWERQPGGTAQRVSNLSDNCQVKDISDARTNGQPRVAMNCPPGILMPAYGAVAWYDGVKFKKDVLTRFLDAKSCQLEAINNLDQVAGVCTYNNGGSRAVIWTNPRAVPTLMTSIGGNTKTAYFNDEGVALIDVTGALPPRTSDWVVRYADGTFHDLPTPSGFTNCSVGDMAQSVVKVLMRCSPINSPTYATAFTWSPSQGLVELPSLPGSYDTTPLAISISGTNGTGYSVSPPTVTDAVRFTLAP